MSAADLGKIFDQFGAKNYRPLSLFLNRGDGAWLWDVDGKRYLDLLAAYSAMNFGHSHPELVRVLTEQAQRLALCSRAFQSEELVLFCKDLAEFCGMESVLPMNSGTEAVETALKIVRKWGAEKKRVPADRAKIVVMANNFHGRTITVVSFSTESTYRDGFGPYTPGFEVVPFGDANALAAAVNPDTLAVLLEPIQAEAGVLIPSPDYLAKAKSICDSHGALLVLDEIQTGLGRTGRNFCFQRAGIVPDVLILGKSLGGGLLPVSAVVTRRDVMDAIQPGQHGSTFGGNPLACAVARRALGLMRELKLADRAEAIGSRIQEQLSGLRSRHVKEIRGQGALIGIELHPTAGGARAYCERLAKLGVLCKETHDHVIRIAPPLTIAFADLHWGVDRIIEVLE